MALTDAKLRNLVNKKNEPLTLSHRDGLRVRRNNNGTVVWQYRCRYIGKQQLITLGYYPEVTIKSAQELVPYFKSWITAGDDPRKKFKEYKQCSSGKPTPAQLADAWYESEQSKYKQKTRILYENQLSKWIVPYLQEKPADDMTPVDWHKFFDFVKDKGSAKTSPVILVRLKTIFRWASMRGLISGNNPLLNLQTKHVGIPTTQGQRWLTFKEIALLWRQIEQSKSTPTTKACLQFIFITGARQSEVRLMRWEHIDFEDKIWTVPSENSKSNKTIRRPLTDKMIEILKNQGLVYGRNGVVFPGANPKKPITTHSINQFCERMWSHLYKKSQVQKFVPHDARRSLSTLLSELGVLPHVTEKMLGHAMRGVMAVYNKHDYISDQRKGYEVYWKHIINAIGEL
ncbi:tyrosine-type recombinase/integrase [Pseudoalteromonas sp. T1lg65]|uniref:tyrosine-type recombinase/integrase n=1 Tax=Pseudoalteromonas sp. T1lg65 TaxID=2077101 RepID=UPI003F78F0EC